jgi:hypothetical protein
MYHCIVRLQMLTCTKLEHMSSLNTCISLSINVKIFEMAVHYNQLCTKECIRTWFQTFAVIWILYVFFWVFPQRQIVICRRFGTLCQFHLQKLGVEYWVSLYKNCINKLARLVFIIFYVNFKWSLRAWGVFFVLMVMRELVVYSCSMVRRQVGVLASMWYVISWWYCHEVLRTKWSKPISVILDMDSL